MEHNKEKKNTEGNFRSWQSIIEAGGVISSDGNDNLSLTFTSPCILYCWCIFKLFSVKSDNRHKGNGPRVWLIVLRWTRVNPLRRLVGRLQQPVWRFVHHETHIMAQNIKRQAALGRRPWCQNKINRSCFNREKQSSLFVRQYSSTSVATIEDYWDVGTSSQGASTVILVKHQNIKRIKFKGNVIKMKDHASKKKWKVVGRVQKFSCHPLCRVAQGPDSPPLSPFSPLVCNWTRGWWDSFETFP